MLWQQERTNPTRRLHEQCSFLFQLCSLLNKCFNNAVCDKNSISYTLHTVLREVCFLLPKTDTVECLQK